MTVRDDRAPSRIWILGLLIVTACGRGAADGSHASRDAGKAPRGQRTWGRFTATGERDGVWLTWSENGTLQDLETWQAGSPNGPFLHWRPNGQLEHFSTWRSGSTDGPALWYFPDGALMTATTYLAGKEHGLHRDFYESGRVRKEMTYDHGMLMATSTEYFPDGTLKRTEEYRGGSLWHVTARASAATPFVEVIVDGSRLAPDP